MSPIHGLTDLNTKAFMKLGQIRKGDRGGKNGAPRDLDHFRVTALPGKNADKLMQTFEGIYGKEPKEIKIRFAYNTVAEVWDAKYECYKKGGLVAQAGSNVAGAYWIFYRHPETNEVLVRNGSAVGHEGREFMDKTPCDPNMAIYYNSEKKPVTMKPTGRLQVVLPELAHLGVGYFEFRPKSPKDIRNISNELAAYEATARQYQGTLAGIPFKLIRREEDVTKKINGQLVMDKGWVAHIIADGEWATKAFDVIERLALTAVDEPDIIDAEDTSFEEEMPSLESSTPLLQMPYDQAKTVLVKDKNDKELFMTELTTEQLQRVAKSTKATNEQKLAAQTILTVDRGG